MCAFQQHKQQPTSQKHHENAIELLYKKICHIFTSKHNTIRPRLVAIYAWLSSSLCINSAEKSSTDKKKHWTVHTFHYLHSHTIYKQELVYVYSFRFGWDNSMFQWTETENFSALHCAVPQIRNDFHTKIAHKCHVQSSLLLQRQRQRVCPRHTSTRMPQFRCSTVSGCSYAISMLFIDGPGRKLVSPRVLEPFSIPDVWLSNEPLQEFASIRTDHAFSFYFSYEIFRFSLFHSHISFCIQ